MNKEQQQIIDEVYVNYLKEQEKVYKIRYNELSSNGFYEIDLDWQNLSKEQFINKIKTDNEFSERWGLKIEERELSLEERNEWFKINLNGNNPLMKSDWKDFELDQQNIPTKLITLTYKDKKIESYE